MVITKVFYHLLKIQSEKKLCIKSFTVTAVNIFKHNISKVKIKLKQKLKSANENNRMK